MTNLMLIEDKISSIKKYLKILERYKKLSRKEIEQNIDLRGAVERYLYLVTQATIDLAETIIAYKKFRKPTTYSENFDILKEETVISTDLTKNMIDMAGFRNIMTHDYDKLDYKKIYDVLKNKLTDIEKFVKSVSKYLSI
ncbi:hypothetical protein COX95_01605 [bacterium CG_4_10_14_0_2_um_filter_33_32]|nr:MAG: hypothetical protein AUJ93_03495 [bacterium CG2_30_33_46]PIR67927.1 MAG: hypothetical protein COU50_00690 [bacterium CG10_big_fil_rev_8_21_14_0_10_33_18]PIU76864.1 MAG: hypothetical protein COS74_01875 [bacterium CG06_land_8_20_14_3_00_33_50]PIW80852.1 MAG: hypothetical protein COZ97_04400 [bacterium CG_4_8_14_3_um_filter_33_28]PIY85381.1 MAG: hypothetical protein COY76_02390 [bacterium CG_4_10_14_0_8_um_filter_33_57]PIZ86324.1 MAG: hypothetical protein COX95_01605 [bacterium CG_4_10_1